MGTSGLAGYGFANDLMRSCDIAIDQSVDDGICIVKLEGNQAIVSAIISALVAFIRTF